MLSAGRFTAENSKKPYDEYHYAGTHKMPARPDLPIQGGERPYQQVMGEAIGERIAGVLRVG